MQRKAIKVNPERFHNNTVEFITDNSLKELNEHLSQGWTIESETILPVNVSVSNHTIGYKGLASVIYILRLD